MDGVSDLQRALGAELLRARMLGTPLPRVADRYRIDAILGRGASGVVVGARDEDLGREVALKLTLEEPGQTDLGEAKSLASLHHVNVVLLYDASVAKLVLGERKFRVRLLSMQRVDGVSLRVWLRELKLEGARRSKKIIDVFVSAGAGLAAAHAKKIIHRDFKPENVLVARDGTAKVLDFGFAVTASSTRSAELGRVSGVAGTFAYMAPEARDGLASFFTDQYAFAMTLAEALSSVLELPRETAPPHVSAAVWAALRRATSDDASDRFPSMGELLVELRDATRSEPSESPRLRTVVGGLVVVGVSIAGIFIFAGSGWRAPSRAGEDTTSTLEDRVDAVRIAAPPAPPASPPPVPAPDLAPSAACVADTQLFDLHTHAGSRTSHYELTLEHRADCSVEVALRRTQTGTAHATLMDQTLVTSAVRLSDVDELSFAAELADANRTYAFQIPTDAPLGNGRFTSDDPEHGHIAGTVDIEHVSHFGADLGHDPQETPP